MRCVVTAGPTYEPLDQVRRMTNFSTGRLGTELANFLAQRGHDTTLLIGEQATWNGERTVTRVDTFTTTADLRDQLRALSAQSVDAVFHAAAVSDYAFGKVWLRLENGETREVKSGKLSTREGTLLAELIPTPKIIAELRGWYPRAFLAGWKYEVEGDRASVLAAARAQLAQCRVNACVANGPAFGPGFGLVEDDAGCTECRDSATLFVALESRASRAVRQAAS